jgi:hypothetical protein
MWDVLSSGLISVAVSVIQLFPPSPFSILDELSSSGFYTWLCYLNWFVPISTFVAIFEVWLSGVAIYYIYQVVLRWIKVIE